jgi:hypothetical protein
MGIAQPRQREGIAFPSKNSVADRHASDQAGHARPGRV